MEIVEILHLCVFLNRDPSPVCVFEWLAQHAGDDVYKAECCTWLSIKSKTEHNKCQLVNFIVGQAKLAVYLSRKKQNTSESRAMMLYQFLGIQGKSRISLELNVYKAMRAVEISVTQ